MPVNAKIKTVKISTGELKIILYHISARQRIEQSCISSYKEQTEEISLIGFCWSDDERLPRLQGELGYCSWRRNAMSKGGWQPGQNFLKCEELRSMTRKGMVNCCGPACCKCEIKKITKIYSEANSAFTRHFENIPLYCIRSWITHFLWKWYFHFYIHTYTVDLSSCDEDEEGEDKPQR